ncbi:aldo/keto reductase [Anaeromyxobacter dehalogenans 2CP-1]|uniref:Aldo/keto reductase n=1 Tax=Anaeromyxobacter dehalogenans (strain ATCC BAA-258 / DSM 21875 / 2CP-1) TaxID=455488 RepID=B8JGY8_ANAD2|nr:aldo/keto reductase [Anaeromyxobacter dehalogenans]ACL66625.1 aldo/keto reductase [Anaeromyxobacter dehalogenans 2CP-1]
MEIPQPPRTAPAVRRLGLGMAALGRPAYHTIGHGADFPEGRSPEQLRRHAHAVLDAAHDAGIRHFDAARSYGAGEAFLRAWADARGLGPGDLTVSSKWGYRYVGGWRVDAEKHEVKDHSLEALRRQHAESVEALGPLLSLYQIHSVTADGPVLGDGAVLDELTRLRDGGLRLGVTVSGPGQAEAAARALGIERGGRPLFTAVQGTWNLLERSCEAVLGEAHASGRLVIVKEPLANGRLGPRGDVGSDGPLARVAREAGTTPDALALAAALARPWADLVLLGAATVDQLRSNLRALELQPRAEDQERLAALVEPPARYWARRATLAWT